MGVKKLMKNFFDSSHAHEGTKSMTYRLLLLCLCYFFMSACVGETHEGASCVSRKIINKEFEQASICKDDKP